MKKLLAILFTVMLPFAAFAEAQDANWLEISNEDRVLTVRLPWQEGSDWQFDVFDGDCTAPLELLTMEVIGDEAAEAGQERAWVASFARFGGSGEARLWLNCGGTEARYIRLNVSEDGALSITDADTYAWDGRSLTVGLLENPSTGYGWSWVDTPALKLIDMQFVQNSSDELRFGAPGCRTLRFESTGQGGEVELTLVYARSWEQEPAEARTLRLDVSAEGEISILSVSEK